VAKKTERQWGEQVQEEKLQERPAYTIMRGRGEVTWREEEREEEEQRGDS
jgi:hypothetical protein